MAANVKLSAPLKSGLGTKNTLAALAVALTTSFAEIAFIKPASENKSPSLGKVRMRKLATVPSTSVADKSI